MGHNYHHVRAAVRGGRKKKIPSPKEDSVTDLGQKRTMGHRSGMAEPRVVTFFNIRSLQQ